MSNEKICEYLSEKGVLLFENIDLFFQINSSLNNKNFKNEPEQLKESLFLYLQKTTKNDNLLRLISSQIIDSYYNSQAITKYKNIKNLINILHIKLLLNFNSFVLNASRYIMNKENDNMRNNEHKKSQKSLKQKSKPKKKEQRPKKTNQYKNNYYTNIQDSNISPHSFFVNNNDYNYLNMYNNEMYDNYNPNIENINISNINNGNNDDDNIVSRTFYSPMINFKSTKPINNYNPNNSNEMLMNMNDNINYSNNYNNNNNSNYINQSFSNNYEYQEMLSPFKKIQPQIYNLTNNYNNNSHLNDPQDDYDFLENERRHMQKIQNKIMNLKNERILKLEEQCTFSPKINNTYKIPRNRYHTKSDINISSSNQNFNNSQQTENDTSFLTRYHNKNTFEKLYNDSSVNKIKKEERIKKYLEEFKFTPNIEGNEKYQIKSSFEQRRKSSIDARAKFRNKKIQEEMDKKKLINNKKGKIDEKEIVNRLYGKEIKKIEEKRKSEKKIKEKEEKKKHVIDWNKVYKNYYEKYPEGDDYKRHLEKRRKFMESANNIDKNKKKENNVMEFNDFLKQKEINNNVDNNIEENKNEIKDDIKENEEINNKDKEKDIGKDEESNNKNENTEQITVNEVKSAINDAYKSKSLKNLLGENKFKKED